MNTSILEFPDWQRTLTMMTDRYGLDNQVVLDDKSLTKAGVDCDFFIQVINIFGSKVELPIEQLKSFPIPVILDYLEKTHRYYLNKKLLEIEQSISNLQTQTPENQLLPFLKSFYNWVKDNLIFHIQMEEEQLFPYIKALYNQLEVTSDFTIKHFVEHHSDTVELQISEVKKHIVRAQQSAYEIFPFKVLLKQLDELEKDLRIHAKIEDEVLIPKAIDLENRLYITLLTNSFYRKIVLQCLHANWQMKMWNVGFVDTKSAFTFHTIEMQMMVGMRMFMTIV